MLSHDLEPLRDALQQSWGIDTCDPSDRPSWSERNPALGQCGVTALVVNDMLGAQLLIGAVTAVDGSSVGVHYWNRIDGVDIDFTRSQFIDGEIVGEGRVVDRPAGPPTRCADEYELLRSRVAASLDRANSAALRPKPSLTPRL